MNNLTNGFFQIKNIAVFDFDGVLVDSNDIKSQAFADLYKIYGEEQSAIAVKFHQENSGMSRYEKFSGIHRLLFGKSIDLSQLESLGNQFGKLVLDKIISAPEIDGALDTLQYLHKYKKKCYINSATPYKELREIVLRRGISNLFYAILGSPHSKVDNLKKIIDWNGKVEDIIFFGDSSCDKDAADVFGVEFFGIGKKILSCLSEAQKETHWAPNFLPVVNYFEDFNINHK